MYRDRAKRIYEVFHREDRVIFRKTKRRLLDKAHHISLLKTISLVKNLSRCLALKDIAEFLDEDISKIQKIAGVIHQNTEADEEKLYALLELTNNVKTEKNMQNEITKDKKG